MSKENYIKDYELTFTIRGDEIKIIAPARFDSKTNELLYDKELDDAAIEMANEQYRRNNGFLSISQIKEIRSNIGLSGRDFATLMGWSPTTIVMYENGALPTTNNNEQLKLIFENPQILFSYYESKKSLFSDKAQKKIESFISKVKENQQKNMVPSEELSVLNVAKYICSKTENITAMKLQKLVFYCQSWSLAKYDKPLFPEDFQAWAKGPVCLELNCRHKGIFTISADFLEDIQDKKFTSQQLEIMNGVLHSYGNKSPDFLSKLTHEELPWKEARKGIPDGAKCTNIIDKETMQQYYGGLFYAGLFPLKTEKFE